jgi:esterase FrsA
MEPVGSALRCRWGWEHYLASLAYGGARFPCLADPAKEAAMDHQVEQYTLAAPGFPVGFERHIVTARHHEAVVEVPVHVLSPADAGADTPVLIASGGIDTWKMDLHPMWEALALGAKVRIVAFEHAGVGELTHIPMAPDTQEIICGLLDFARTLTTGKVGHFGLSFGGYFSAQTGLRGDADAAVVLGGPVTSATFGPEHAKNLLFGMADIVGNAVGFTAKPGHGRPHRRHRALRPRPAAGHPRQLPDASDQRRRRRARPSGGHNDFQRPAEHAGRAHSRR